MIHAKKQKKKTEKSSQQQLSLRKSEAGHTRQRLLISYFKYIEGTKGNWV